MPEIQRATMRTEASSEDGGSQQTWEEDYANDFELVIQTRKVLEQLLTKRFHAKQATLMDKVTHLEQTTNICPWAVHKMKCLVESKWSYLLLSLDCENKGSNFVFSVQNCLLHDVGVTGLPPDLRINYRQWFAQVMSELDSFGGGDALLTKDPSEPTVDPGLSASWEWPTTEDPPEDYRAMEQEIPLFNPCGEATAVKDDSKWWNAGSLLIVLVAGVIACVVVTVCSPKKK
jgi:hypothetical protein